MFEDSLGAIGQTRQPEADDAAHTQSDTPRRELRPILILTFFGLRSLASEFVGGEMNNDHAFTLRLPLAPAMLFRNYRKACFH
jgi:hypothetical protein